MAFFDACPFWLTCARFACVFLRAASHTCAPMISHGCDFHCGTGALSRGAYVELCSSIWVRDLREGTNRTNKIIASEGVTDQSEGATWSGAGNVPRCNLPAYLLFVGFIFRCGGFLPLRLQFHFPFLMKILRSRNYQRIQI